MLCGPAALAIHYRTWSFRRLVRTLPWPHLLVAGLVIWFNYSLFSGYEQFRPYYGYSLVPYSWGRYLGNLLLPLDLTVNMLDLSPGIVDYISNVGLAAVFAVIGFLFYRRGKNDLFIIWLAGK